LNEKLLRKKRTKSGKRRRVKKKKVHPQYIVTRRLRAGPQPEKIFSQNI